MDLPEQTKQEIHSGLESRRCKTKNSGEDVSPPIVSWSTINTNCSMWSGVLTEVDNMNPSGTNDKDRVSSIVLSIFVLFHVHT
jgi:hypothetical protein